LNFLPLPHGQGSLRLTDAMSYFPPSAEMPEGEFPESQASHKLSGTRVTLGSTPQAAETGVRALLVAAGEQEDIRPFFA
jgi:hypothetical protein